MRCEDTWFLMKLRLNNKYLDKIKRILRCAPTLRTQDFSKYFSYKLKHSENSKEFKETKLESFKLIRSYFNCSTEFILISEVLFCCENKLRSEITNNRK